MVDFLVWWYLSIIDFESVCNLRESVQWDGKKEQTRNENERRKWLIKKNVENRLNLLGGESSRGCSMMSRLFIRFSALYPPAHCSAVNFRLTAARVCGRKSDLVFYGGDLRHRKRFFKYFSLAITSWDLAKRIKLKGFATVSICYTTACYLDLWRNLHIYTFHLAVVWVMKGSTFFSYPKFSLEACSTALVSVLLSQVADDFLQLSRVDRGTAT